MADTGILTPDERVELIDGEIVLKAAKKPPHSAITQQTSDYLTIALKNKAKVRVQDPIHLSRFSEPEPDIAVVQSNPHNYFENHPRPKDVLLVVEVSDTTLNYDLKKKRLVYAKSKLMEYWVIDVAKRLVHVFRNPVNNKYQQESIYTINSVLTIIAFPEIGIQVGSFFP